MWHARRGRLLKIILAGLIGLAEWGTAGAAQPNFAARFPAALRHSDITEGYALIAWTTQPDGRLEDAIVLEASHAAFGESALAALDRKQPPTPGAAIPQYRTLQVLFKRNHAIRTGTSNDVRPGVEHTRSVVAPHPVQSADLAELPARVEGIDPVLPDDLARSGIPASAEVRFVIDETGRVRVPHIVTASSVGCALAALAAVREWRFAPPQSDGHAVRVEAVRTFNVGSGSRYASPRGPVERTSKRLEFASR